MKKVTEDHAKRIETITQVLRMATDSIRSMESKISEMEPKIDLNATDLARVAHEVAENDRLLKADLDLHESSLKKIIEENDTTLKDKLKIMEELIAQLQRNAPTRGLVHGTTPPTEDGAVKRRIENIEGNLKGLETHLRDSLAQQQKHVEHLHGETAGNFGQVSERIAALEATVANWHSQAPQS